MKTFNQFLTEAFDKTSAEKSGYTLYKKGTSPAWHKLFPLRLDTYTKEFHSERDAEAEGDRFSNAFRALRMPVFGRKLMGSGTIGPQRSNDFYPAWIHYIEVE